MIVAVESLSNIPHNGEASGRRALPPPRSLRRCAVYLIDFLSAIDQIFGNVGRSMDIDTPWWPLELGPLGDLSNIPYMCETDVRVGIGTLPTLRIQD